MITKTILLLSKLAKLKATKKIIYLTIIVMFGAILLFGIAILTIMGLMMNAVNDFGQEEIERQETLQQYTINGGAVQNPKSDYAENEVPEEFEDLYKNIADKYGIEWELLAAIHRVETAFSSNNTTSEAGAIGHTQFMKCTWVGWAYPGCAGGLGNADVPEDIYTDPEEIAKYGGEGVDGNGNGIADPMEISDALSATAEKLEKDGANEDIESAIFNYNRSDEYVSKVMSHYSAYQSDVSYVTAGIEDVENLGQPTQTASGGDIDFDYEGDFPPPNESNYDIVTPTYPWGQCTWYVHQRRAEIGEELPPTFSHGGLWGANARAQNFDVGNTPREGAAASFRQGVLNSDDFYGHVAFVEEVNDDGSIVISEANVEGLGVISTRSFTAEEAKQLDYIY